MQTGGEHKRAHLRARGYCALDEHCRHVSCCCLTTFYRDWLYVSPGILNLHSIKILTECFKYFLKRSAVISL